MKYNNIELVPIKKVQVFEEPKEMLVWCQSYEAPMRTMVHCIISRIANPLQPRNVYTSDGWHDYCAEIPKPKTRKMNKDEIDFCLWERNKTECVQVSYDNGTFRCDVWGNYAFDDLSYYRFRTIDKNGKTTEFELPEIQETK